MEGIFISYRRDDAAGYAGRLYDRLAAHFGAERVFMDVEGIEPGTDFVHAIEQAVASCKVLIVIIGDEWVDATDSSGRRRLEDPHDFIRLETATALQRDIRVVPVLVDQTPMPTVAQLPEDLQPLVRRQAVELNHKQWEATSGELIHTLEKILDLPATDDPAPEQTATQEGGGMRWWPLAVVLAIAVAIGLWVVIDTAPKPPAPLTGQAPLPPAAVVTESDPPGAPEPPVAAAPDIATMQPKPAAATVATEVTAPTPEQPSTPARGEPAASEDAVQQEPALVAQPDTTTPTDSTTAGTPQSASTPPPTPPEPTSADSRPLVATAPEEPSVAPPQIVQLTSKAQPGGAEICYRVSGATALSLLPGPGQLANVDNGCEIVTLDASTRLTLTARGDGGDSTREISAAPLPPPPVITTLQARQQNNRLELCYRVNGATRITLSPTPGRVSRSRDCLPLVIDNATRFTLEASGEGGSVRRSLNVQPIAAQPEPQVSARLPAKGESWIYRMRGNWPTSPKRLIRMQVERVDGQQVAESMQLLKPNRRDGGSRSSGSRPAILAWPGLGFEFSPWLGSYLEPGRSHRWAEIDTPALEEWDKWRSSAESAGEERISVEAGQFDCWKVKVKSNRFATGGSTMAGLEPVRIELIVWYAPAAKRYVKSVRRTYSAEGRILEEDHMELVRFGAG